MRTENKIEQKSLLNRNNSKKPIFKGEPMRKELFWRSHFQLKKNGTGSNIKITPSDYSFWVDFRFVFTVWAKETKIRIFLNSTAVKAVNTKQSIIFANPI